MELEFRSSNKIALSTIDEDVTYKQLGNKVIEFKNKFLSEPLEGERIAIIGANSISWVGTFLATWLAKAIPVPIDQQSNVEEIAYILKDSYPKFIIADSEKLETVQNAIIEAKTDTRVISMDEFKNIGVTKLREFSFKFFEDLNRRALIIYTSGTTGGPKGVILNFKNLYANLNAVSIELPIITPNERLLAILPFHHVLPLMGTIVAPMMLHAFVAIPLNLSSEHLMECFKKYEVTMLIVVPRFYQLIIGGIKKKIFSSKIGSMLYRLCEVAHNKKLSKLIFAKVHKALGGHLKFSVCGGAALDPDTDKALRVLGFEVLLGYGMTECAPIITFTRPGDEVDLCVGLPIECAEVKIEDGEVMIRGENVMEGYWNNEEATKDALQDGWLKTGDLGHFDNEGRLFLTGRKKELIVLPNGKNITPDEVENHLWHELSTITELAVTYDDKVLKAIIVPNERELNKLGIHNYHEYFKEFVIDPYNNTAASYKRIASFTLTNKDIPRTRLGKIRRHLLPKFLSSLNDNNDKTENTDEQLDSEVFKEIAEFIKVLGPEKVFPSSHIELDLNLDSLDKINLLAFINKKFNMNLEEVKFKDLQVVKNLVEYVETHKDTVQKNIDEKKEEFISAPLKSNSMIFRVVKLLTKLIFAFTKIKVRGIEKLNEAPAVYIVNHASYIDAPLLMHALPVRILKNFFYGAKQKHLNSFMAAIFKRSLHIIPIDINADLTQSIKRMADALEQKKSLVLFPEGTRTKDGSLGEFKRLFSELALKAGVPVRPIVLKGTRDFLPYGSARVNLKANLEVVILDEIHGDNLDSKSLVERSRDVIQNELNNTEN